MSADLLRTLCALPAPPGREDEFRTFLIEHLSPYADEIRTDPMGNVFFIRKGKGIAPRTIMLAAHMDEISFLVRHITKEGFLYVQPLGGFDPRVLDAQRVWVHGRQRLPGVFGTKPAHFTTPEERTKAVPLEDMFIDLGLPGDTVTELVRIGDPVTLDRDLITMGNCYTGKTLDDRVGVYVMIEAFKQFETSQDTIVAVATVQEEVGVRGAKAAAFGLEPDIGIAVDITIAADIPGIEERNWCVRLGSGTAIKIMDTYSISDPRLVEFLRTLAEEQGIKYQMEILPRGGTDAGGMQLARSGIPVCTLSIPCRYAHSVVETVHQDDVAASIALLRSFCEQSHRFPTTANSVAK
ncbi:MAG: M42 family metallopeptidase [Candidatus Kapabacteria bacterium]|nr:M42 family metallopeptidase [Candidatus Kapabacteria bacterium]